MSILLFRHMTPEELVAFARTALQNALATPDLLAALDGFNFGTARLTPALALVDTAETFMAAFAKEYSEQYQATAALDAGWKAAHVPYDTHRRLAKLLLRNNPQKQKSLLLHESLPRALPGWLAQATTFYLNALGDATLLAGFATYNITQAILEAGQTAVQHVAALNAAQEKEKAEAQASTKTRDAALEALNDFITEFAEIAQLALPANQLREALGFGPVP
jgi:hypothetical protein